jgi:hypothetical protein
LSFRGRLTVFFVLIVVLPMIALAALVVQIAGDSASGKADARLSAELETAIAIYEEAVGEAQTAARRIADDAQLATALQGGDPAAVEARAGELAQELDARSLALVGGDGDRLATIGNRRAIADASVEVAQSGGGTLATVTVSTTSV